MIGHKPAHPTWEVDQCDPLPMQQWVLERITWPEMAVKLMRGPTWGKPIYFAIDEIGAVHVWPYPKIVGVKDFRLP